MRKDVEEGDDREQAQADGEIADNEHDEREADRGRHADLGVHAGGHADADCEQQDEGLRRPLSEVEPGDHALGAQLRVVAPSAARALRSPGVDVPAA